MHRFTLLLALLGSSAAAAAATGIGPSIAYLKEGGRQADEVYLVNPDGSAQTRIHQASGIEGIALRPGGGEIALAIGGMLRVISFDERGQPIGTPRDIRHGYLVGDMDYRADGTLIYGIATGPWQVRTLAPGASQSTVLFTIAGNVTALRWMRDRQTILFTQDDVLKKRTADGQISTLASPGYFPAHVGMRRTADRAVVTDWTRSSELNLATGALSATCKLMSQVRFSPNDVEMVYRAPAGAINSTYLLVQKSDCSGGTFRLGARAGYIDVEWRE